jgi:hypothetical protein
MFDDQNQIGLFVYSKEFMELKKILTIKRITFLSFSFLFKPTDQ